MIHLVSIPVTNTSVNPARSTGPALFVGGWALGQLWLFWVAPLIGGVLGGVIYRWLERAAGRHGAGPRRHSHPMVQEIHRVLHGHYQRFSPQSGGSHPPDVAQDIHRVLHGLSQRLPTACPQPFQPVIRSSRGREVAACPSPKQRPVIPQDRTRGVVAGGAGDAAAGMGAGAAMVEPLQRPAIIGVAEHRPRREQLVQASARRGRYRRRAARTGVRDRAATGSAAR